MFKKVFITTLIIVLGLMNIFFYTRSEKLDYEIIIGTPSGNGSSVERTDLSKPISDRDEADLLIFSLMNSVSVEKPEITESLPDSVIWFNDRDKGISYTVVDVWIEGSSIIFGSNVNSDQPVYKELTGGRAEDFMQILAKHQIKS